MSHFTVNLTPKSVYLTHEDDEAFRGLEKLDPKEMNQFGIIKNPVECPMCKGHGGWILRRDAYGEGKHFMCQCSQCNGFGLVNGESKDATCMHEWKEISHAECKERGISHYGMCWHVYECESCGSTMAQDSSD